MEFEFAVCLLAPALAAWIILRWLDTPLSAARIGAAGLAVALAWFAGYWVLVENNHWWPTRIWHRLPYLGLLAGGLGVLTSLLHRHRLVLAALIILISLVATQALVPNFKGLWPAANQLYALFLIYVSAITCGLVWPDRSETSARRQLCWMTLALFSLAVAGVARYGFTYAQLALVAGSAMTGVLLAIRNRETVGLNLHSLGIWYAWMAGGIALTAATYPMKPRYELMLLPAAPLMASIWDWWWSRRDQKSSPFYAELALVVTWIATVLVVAIVL